MPRLDAEDVCCSIVATLEEAATDPHFAARRAFARTQCAGEVSIPALPIPIVDSLRRASPSAAPLLGSDTDILLPEKN